MPETKKAIAMNKTVSGGNDNENKSIKVGFLKYYSVTPQKLAMATATSLRRDAKGRMATDNSATAIHNPQIQRSADALSSTSDGIS